MSNQGFIVTEASPSEVQRLASIQTAAFDTSPINRAVFGRVEPAARHEQHVQLITAQTGPERATRRVMVARKEGTDEIYGFALWDTPHEMGGESARKKKEWLPGTDLELANVFFASTPRDPRPHYYLSILATDPQYGRMGAGSALLNWGCQKADEEDVNVFLKATDIGLPLYERLGFVKQGDPSTSERTPGVSLFPMIRYPPLRLLPGLPSDASTFASLHYAAFSPGPFFTNLFGKVSPDDKRAILYRRFSRRLQPEMKNHVFVKAVRAGEVVGFSYWLRVVPGEEEEEPPREYAEGANVELAKDFFQKVTTWQEGIKEAHWDLDILSVDPALQRTGAGKALLLWGIDEATKEGMDVYLEATTAGEPIYLKYGFEASAPPIVASDGSFSVLPMVRRRTP